jgi:aerotaxis receptor
MHDMQAARVAGNCRETALTFHDGTQRRVLYNDVEVPYPEGRLIVSRTDTAGRITHANRAFVEMSGYCVDELIGQPHAILRHPDMPAAAFADLWDTVSRGEKWHGYVKNLRADGAHYWVYATVIANVRAGKVVGFTSVRRKPCAARVREAATVYATMRKQEG